MPHAPETFVHLHNHTEYSLLDGASRIPAMVARAAELGMPAIGLTDHGVMYGAIHFYKACKDAGIKPIVGCEVYVAPRSRLLREGRVDRDPNHLTLLAANAEGYVNLMKLCTVGQMEGMYYKPRIDKEILAEHSKGLIALSGCLQGEPASRIVEGDLDGARESVATYRDIFGKDRFLLEVQRHGIDRQAAVNEALAGFGREFGLRLCATNDLHYVHRDDSEAHDVLLCLQTGARFNDPNRWRFSTQENYLKTPQEMIAAFTDLPEALASTLEVADQCDLKISLGATLLPPFDVPDGLTPDQYLRKVVEEGMRWRYGEPSAAVKERAGQELSVIKETGYASYFLIVWDFYKFARQHDIVVGPGRGSAAGSLVSYCLGITNLDPIEHGLIFERFLNIDRVSMPDIDCDFSVEGRERVIRYVSDKYGSDRVAQIITFTTMASKAAIRDVGRVLEVPLRDTDRLAKLVPVWQGRSKTLEDTVKEVAEFREAYESNEEAKRLVDVAKALEGVSRNVSTHAAGVVIAPEPLVRYTPLQYGPGREAVVTQYDMKAVGDIGLLKIDFLGLQNLDIIATCLRLIKERRGLDIDIEKIPLDDAKTYELIANADTHGVFQFEGAGMRRMLTDMRPQSFGDVSAAVALFRPGPMVNIPAFIARKQGREAIEYMHERLEPILRETYGVMIYQEQVMMAARELAGFTMSEADILRAAMGKKDKVKMAKLRTKFVEGTVERGIAQSTAEVLFDGIAKFAEYGFNRAHSAAYGLIAYQTAYLKANYPLEYMAALLIHMEGNAERVATAIVDCKLRGIDVQAPDINRSRVDFSIPSAYAGDGEGRGEGGAQILFGLAAIKNVGRHAVETMVAMRESDGPFKSLEDLCERTSAIQDVNRRVLESLVQSGACDSLGERAWLLAVLEHFISRAEQARKDREAGQTNMLELIGSTEEDASNFGLAIDVQPMPGEEKLQLEKELLGLYLSDHPLRRIAAELARLSDAQAVEVTSALQDTEVRVAGLVREVRRVVTRKGQIMAYATLEDLTGAVDVVLFPRVFEQARLLFEPDKVVVVQGKVDARAGSTRATGSGGAPQLEPELEAEVETASIVADMAWLWDDPECVPVARRQLVHVKIPTGDAGLAERLEAVLARHPGTDQVVLHVVVGSREVIVNADRYHVLAGPALAAEIDELVGQAATKFETVRPKAQSNGNGRGNGDRGRRG
ncbi:MAG TPA: DNA polymerase III subunit alpha [Candidatus Dormibacteraeota bacterium]|nr:DNA polymerase III subunit alpha [Candidatus Dormibacteraeota bacterium]